MHPKSLQDILPNIQKPSRYLGTEINRICKNTHSVALKIALAFPDLYDIGTSHFGLQILYHILNHHEDIAAERVFAPAKDMEALLRQQGQPLTSLENHLSLDQFDIIGFSLLYELNYSNVLNMLDLAGIPLTYADRDDRHPLVIAGGPCICNPEPMADFFDAMVFGDGEHLVLEMAEQWLHWQQAGRQSKQELLRQWAQIQGVYVPRFYKAVYDNSGRQRLRPDADVGAIISRRIVANLDKAAFPSQPIIPFGKPVHDRLRLEIARGCTRGCRFCQAGMIYRPVRERSPERLLELAKDALKETGYEDLSLLSLSTGDYTCLGPLMEALMRHCQEDRVAVSLPSLRAGSLSPELMSLIQSVRKTGFTIAPEAGSQRLRNVINKNICFDDVAATVRDAFSLGWRVIKLYFMIGLPTETPEDLKAIVDMVQRLKGIKGPKGQRAQINVSVTTFIPKAHTPFQWAQQISMAQAGEKIKYLKSELTRIRGVRFKWQDPAMSLLEGIMARGDRRLGPVLMDAWKNGCTFDGWTDQFNFERWQASFQACGVPMDQLSNQELGLDDPLPWDHMDAGIDQAFLKAQWKNAMAGTTLDDCRQGQCHQCGVCDFNNIKPAVFNSCQLVQTTRDEAKERVSNQAHGTYHLLYEKLDSARFFGHLELSHLFSRAIRRAGIPVVYSQGYHPMPKISFDNPLPLGIESQGERMRLKLSMPMDCHAIIESINPFLPKGLQLVECRLTGPGRLDFKPLKEHYRIQLDRPIEDFTYLRRFAACEQWYYERTRHKGRSHTIDLRAGVHDMVCHNGQILDIIINKNYPHTIRPMDVLMGVLDLPQETIAKARIIKLMVSLKESVVDKVRLKR